MPSRETTSTASIQTESRAGTPPLEQALVLSSGTVPHTSVERQDLGIMISLYLAQEKRHENQLKALNQLCVTIQESVDVGLVIYT